MTLRDFRQDFNKNFDKITSLLGEFADQVALDLPSPKAKRILNSALDFLRPHFLSLGIRIVRLSPQQIEILVPAKARNLDESGMVMEGILTSVGIEAFKMLWKRNAPQGHFENKVSQFSFEKIKELKGDIRLRCELSEISREAVLAELVKDKRSRVQVQIDFYNLEEQICAQLALQSELFLKEMIDWK